ncbi:ABC transporter permease [Portibacter lacus]|uniref:ABC transporter permease n=1 Tax=Portibacter lacus TaxID=1099794 RepID=A0AA37SMT8_9BACT|nr:ABC transporter permease [Portibacter lacus]GLR17648.1 ABC transporter permease [Portibacter lacus]
MDKILLIFKREYLTRVFKKSFLLTTLLTPLAIFVLVLVLGTIMTYDSDDAQTVLVSDPGNILNGDMNGSNTISYQFSDKDLEQIKGEYSKNGEFAGILYVPEISDLSNRNHTIFYYSDEKLSIDVNRTISRSVRSKIKDYKIVQLGIDPSQLDKLNTDITLDPEPISADVEDSTSDSTFVRAILGGAMGYIMFFIIIIYGMMVMRSVMEEKINRIVEIMISSVKPFQMMLGKILGVGAVGLTQIIIWTVLIMVLSTVAYSILGIDPQEMSELAANGANLPAEMENSTAAEISNIFVELGKVNWLMIIPLFIIYFIGGYIIYTSLFAAVGSAIGDDLNEGNSLTMPLMMPIILAVYIMFKAVESPNSSLAVWSSMIPFLSPIVMPARLAADIPFWQIALSVALLALFCFFSVWIAARIYRVGILLYGKKASIKEIGKWIFTK